MQPLRPTADEAASLPERLGAGEALADFARTDSDAHAGR